MASSSGAKEAPAARSRLAPDPHRKAAARRPGGQSTAKAGGPPPEPLPVPHFRALTGRDPWPWQRRLHAALVRGEVPQAVAVPTGAGKTAAVPIALLARLANPELPRRIVYIVDRRAIVDQTAEAVRVWIDRMGELPALARAFDAGAAFPAERPVGLGVLRGGLADDGAWRADPSRPAVVVGTVDLVGSRLLFRGYGDGRSRRATHAGLLGQGALVVLDEAHLAPAMEALLRALEGMDDGPALRVLTLSATGGAAPSKVLTLSEDDLRDESLGRRLRAVKRLRLRSVPTRAARVGAMCEAALAHRTGAVAVYVERVEDARRIGSGLARAKGAGRIGVLTGTLRGHERAALTTGAVWRRFAPGREHERALPAVYLVMTSAGEVGVDLDADHAVMDLTPVDSMLQRLGRVNRTGGREATVTVVHTPGEVTAAPSSRTRAERRRRARRETLAVLGRLPDLSPDALRGLDPETMARCTVPVASPARLDRVLVESLAATSAELSLPPVGMYLKGAPETRESARSWLGWRRDVADLVRAGPDSAKAALSFFRPDARELARVPAALAERIVARALGRSRGRRLPLVVASSGGEVHALVLDDEARLPPLAWATVLLPPEAGGLAASGLPDEDAAGRVPDVGDTCDRVRYLAIGGSNEPEAGRAPPPWLDRAVTLRIGVPAEGDGDEEREWIYALRRAETGGDTSSLGGGVRTLAEHGRRVGEAARRLGQALGLEGPLVEALGLAGEWHDAGKSRARWQLAAGVPPGAVPLAKSRRGRLRAASLRGYRHEHGSVADAERALPEDIPHRDLVLHLVAAHHGWARPGIPLPAQWDPEGSPASNLALARRIEERYARLTARYGPWRLAWLEALLKAADARVSAGWDR